MNRGPKDAGKTPAVAVALRYDRAGAPRVTAKGEGHLAARLAEIARQNGVPIEEDALLAQALAQVELDQEIPEELYRAVAVIIGHVLRQTENA